MSYKEEVGFSVQYTEGNSWDIDRYEDEEEYEIDGDTGILSVSNIDGELLIVYRDWIRIKIHYEDFEEEDEDFDEKPLTDEQIGGMKHAKAVEEFERKFPIRAKLEKVRWV